MSYYYPKAVVSLRIIIEDFKSGAPDMNKAYALNVQPKSFNVHMNDYTQADTFDMELDYRTFPFDPRAIRACGVSIFIQDLGKFTDKNGVVQDIDPSSDSANGNCIFQGYADEESISFDDNRRVIRLQGRDYTGLLLDTKYIGIPGTGQDQSNAGGLLPMNLTVDALVKKLLKKLPATANLPVINRTGTPLPTLASFYPTYSSEFGGARQPKADENYWDIITDVVAKAGLICYFEIDRLIITQPRTLYDRSKAKQLIYGQNIKSLEFKRKLGRMKGLNVRVVTLDTRRKKVIDAKIPLEADPTWCKALGIAKAENKIPTISPDGSKGPDKPANYHTVRLTNINSKAQLIQAGQKIFEEISRQEIEGTLATKDMSTTDWQSNPFDLTKTRIGTPVMITVDQLDMTEIQHASTTADREAYLKRRGYDPKVAHQLAVSLGDYDHVFYTKSAHIAFDNDSGFELKIDFINFIELGNKGLNLG